MTLGLFRVRTAAGEIRLARGQVEEGPSELLPAELTIAALLANEAGADAIARAVHGRADGPLPRPVSILSPVDRQEIWAAGVTYERSRDARMDEAREPSIYDRVYEATRPELFFKSAAWRVRGPGQAITIRADSGWDVPEPELAIVATRDLQVAGFTIANDVSSRTIEGENPLYLPQAKIYDGACAIGPAIVPLADAAPPFEIRLVIARRGSTIVDETTSSGRLRRSFEDLLEHLGRALAFPHGVVLLTGTGIVPEDFTLTAGDIVRISIDSLGTLENPVAVVGHPDAQPLEAVGPSE
jgi:2-dehydro-3-deoxy-D-arabinonate dehydratase